MKKVFALVLALALVMCGFTACSGKNGGSDTKTDADLTKVGEYTANNTEYVIGATGPLTGDASSYGNSVRNGAQLAVDEINAAGGLNGVNFKFDMKDDKAGAVGSLWDVVRDRRLPHRPEVTSGVLADESAALLRAFFRDHR